MQFKRNNSNKIEHKHVNAIFIEQPLSLNRNGALNFFFVETWKGHIVFNPTVPPYGSGTIRIHKCFKINAHYVRDTYAIHVNW